MQIGILGGTGPAGSGLAARLASVGHDVVIGSRSAERAGEVVDKLHERWTGRDLAIRAADNGGAADAEFIVVATPWDAAWTTAKSVREQLAGKVVLSMANALVRVGHEFQPLVPPRGSVAASVQAAVPASQVVAALHHVPAKELGDLDHAVESDVLVCSDHATAKQTCMDLLAEMRDIRPLDAGDLTQAAPIEAFTAVMLQLNVRYKTRVAVRFTGLDLD
jgi:8-hydroxy-5-deazaflavin:NADPH oxidoreductase